MREARKERLVHKGRWVSRARGEILVHRGRWMSEVRRGRLGQKGPWVEQGLPAWMGHVVLRGRKALKVGVGKLDPLAQSVLVDYLVCRTTLAL